MNPKQQFGLSKVPFHYFPMTVLAEASVGMLEGGLKYGAHNYRNTAIFASTYADAAMRHILSAWEGEDIDPDSGLPHIVKAICSLAVWRDAEINGKLVDDRPLKPPGNWLIKLADLVRRLQEKYPTPKAPFLEVDRVQVPVTCTPSLATVVFPDDCIEECQF